MADADVEEFWVPQGSQPRFLGVSVGVIRIGEPEGVASARVRISDGEHSVRTDVTAQDPADLLGRGTLHLLGVERPRAGERARVRFRAVPTS